MTDSSDCPAISIIVPVYNVASYLEAGLESLLAQDFSEPYEIILIDDASTDNSLAICRKLVDRHPDRFTLIECETNAGVSVARNFGLDRAQGRYLAFFDPDDILPPEALTRLHTVAESQQADIVKGNLVLFDEQGQKPAPDEVRHTRVIEGDAVLTALYEHRFIRGHIAGKLLRRESLGDFRLPVGVRMAQDLLYFAEVFAQARSLVLLAGDVYCYRKHGSGSTGGKYRRGSYLDWLESVERTGDFARSKSHQRAHKSLLLRSLTQIAREVRKLSPDEAKPALQEIERRRKSWEINLWSVLRARLGPSALIRYAKFSNALNQIRRNLS